MYLGCTLDLKSIAMRARNSEYNPKVWILSFLLIEIKSKKKKRFSAVIMRIREPKTTALVFASGKMVITGAKTEDDSRVAARKYARLIQKLDYPNVKFKDFKVQNIVGSCDVKFPIRLEGLAYSHTHYSTVSLL